MDNFNYEESITLVQIMFDCVVIFLFIFSNYLQIKLKRKMQALEKLTTKIANKSVTESDVKAVVAESNKGLLDLINQNETNDVDTRETLNQVIKKINESLEIDGHDVPAPTPTEPTVDVPVQTNPEEETPAEGTPETSEPTEQQA
jgi:hypothetical protein